MSKKSIGALYLQDVCVAFYEVIYFPSISLRKFDVDASDILIKPLKP